MQPNPILVRVKIPKGRMRELWPLTPAETTLAAVLVAALLLSGLRRLL